MRAKNNIEPLPKTRRFVGITMVTLTDDMLKELRQPNFSMPADLKNGVLVWRIFLGSPAHV